jgi:hypothetical protein
VPKETLGPQHRRVDLFLRRFQGRSHLLLCPTSHGTVGTRGGGLQSSHKRIDRHSTREKLVA